MQVMVPVQQKTSPGMWSLVFDSPRLIESRAKIEPGRVRADRLT